MWVVVNLRAVAKLGYVCWPFGQTRRIVWVAVDLMAIAKVEWHIWASRSMRQKT